MSKFGYSKTNPFHLSVAALVTDDAGQIGCHHFQEPDLAFERGALSDLYILMRETLHDNETIEAGVARGLLEELGATGRIVRFIGSIQSHFPYVKNPKRLVEKTTLYFHVELDKYDESERAVDAEESKSIVEWHEPQELLTILQQQEKQDVREDVNDVKIIQDFIAWQKNNPE